MQWMWWVAGLLGVWLIISPFLLGYTNHVPAMINDFVIGIFILGITGWLAWVQRAMDRAKISP